MAFVVRFVLFVHFEDQVLLRSGFFSVLSGFHWIGASLCQNGKEFDTHFPLSVRFYVSGCYWFPLHSYQNAALRFLILEPKTHRNCTPIHQESSGACSFRQHLRSARIILSQFRY